MSHINPDGWIDVRDRLPERSQLGDTFIVYNANRPGDGVEVGCWWHEGRWVGMCDSGCGPSDIAVTHWQPLPAPPVTTTPTERAKMLADVPGSNSALPSVLWDSL